VTRFWFVVQDADGNTHDVPGKPVMRAIFMEGGHLLEGFTCECVPHVARNGDSFIVGHQALELTTDNPWGTLEP
jgi:hypothetical protein